MSNVGIKGQNFWLESNAGTCSTLNIKKSTYIISMITITSKHHRNTQLNTIQIRKLNKYNSNYNRTYNQRQQHIYDVSLYRVYILIFITKHSMHMYECTNGRYAHYLFLFIISSVLFWTSWKTWFQYYHQNYLQHYKYNDFNIIIIIINSLSSTCMNMQILSIIISRALKQSQICSSHVRT